MLTVEPILDNVYLGNRVAVRILLNDASTKGRVFALNVCGDRVKGARNDIFVKDNERVPVEEYVDFLRRATAVLEAERARHEFVVVNCWAGMDRSAAVVVAWMALYKGYTVDGALQRVRNVKISSEEYFGGPEFEWPTLNEKNTRTGAKALVQACRVLAGERYS